MKFIFLQSCKIRPATLPKIHSFTSIFKGFFLNMQLSPKISRHFRNFDFPEHLPLPASNRSSQFSKYFSSQNYILRARGQGLLKIKTLNVSHGNLIVLKWQKIRRNHNMLFQTFNISQYIATPRQAVCLIFSKP